MSKRLVQLELAEKHLRRNYHEWFEVLVDKYRDTD
jgi:hypothetical protein